MIIIITILMMVILALLGGDNMNKKSLIFAALLLPVMSYSMAADANFNRYTSIPTNEQFRTVKSDEVLQAGSIIPATLITKITSDNMQSVVVAVVRQSVYDSVTGRNLLIPAGSRLIGEPMGMTNARINISFQRIIFPNGHSVQLPNFEAIDGLGQSGVKDKYTKHTWLKLRSVLTGSVIAGIAGLADKSESVTTSNGETVTRSDNKAMEDAIAALIDGVTNIAQQDADIPPTGTINEAYQFNLMLHADIQIRPYRR